MYMDIDMTFGGRNIVAGGGFVREGVMGMGGISGGVDGGDLAPNSDGSASARFGGDTERAPARPLLPTVGVRSDVTERPGGLAGGVSSPSRRSKSR